MLLKAPQCARRPDPDQFDSDAVVCGRRLVIVDRDAGWDNAHPLGPSTGSERTVGQEVVTGNHGVGHANRCRETPRPPRRERTARVERIAVQDGIVKVENKPSRLPA
jgi:hypothetical protein